MAKSTPFCRGAQRPLDFPSPPPKRRRLLPPADAPRPRRSLPCCRLHPAAKAGLSPPRWCLSCTREMQSGEEGLEESSSQRRERLLALRSAATAPSPGAAAEAAAPLPSPAETLLPDPGLAGDPPSSPHLRQPHRFDYYTNPAAAFSSSGGDVPPSRHKRPRASAPYDYSPAPPPPYGSNNRPPYQHHMAPPPVYSPFPRPQNAPGNEPWGSPMQFQESMSGYRGTTPGAPAPPWGPHWASSVEGSYPNSPSFGLRHPNPGRGGGPMNYRPRGSPHLPYRQGQGPDSRGRGGRGGVGFQNRPMWQDRRSYFNRSMVDDPWQNLQPVVGNILIPRGSSKSWLPESLRKKKDTPQVEKKSTSGLSLAEYLDLSFNEAANET